MSDEIPEIGINGMAHVILTVSQFDKARSFYSGLLPKFGMVCVIVAISASVQNMVDMFDSYCCLGIP